MPEIAEEQPRPETAQWGARRPLLEEFGATSMLRSAIVPDLGKPTAPKVAIPKPASLNSDLARREARMAPAGPLLDDQEVPFEALNQWDEIRADQARIVGHRGLHSGVIQLGLWYVHRVQAIFYAVYDIGSAEDWVGAITAGAIEVLRKRIRAEQERDPSFNRGYRPLILVAGPSMANRLQQQLRAAGAMVFDMDLPANARFQSVNDLIVHLDRISQPVEPILVKVFQPDKTVAATDVSAYYKPITENDGALLSQFVEHMNQDVPEIMAWLREYRETHTKPAAHDRPIP